MAWINFELMEAKGMKPSEFLFLQACKQNKNGTLANTITELGGTEKYISALVSEDILSLIKGSKKNTIQQRVRLTKKGESLLEDVQTADITENDITLYNWLADIYLRSGKELGNKAKGKRMLAQFRAESGIEGNSLAVLCKAFIEDEDASKWSQKLEYLFFKAPNVYTVRFDLGESKLYNYYLKYKTHFDKLFETL